MPGAESTQAFACRGRWRAGLDWSLSLTTSEQSVTLLPGKATQAFSLSLALAESARATLLCVKSHGWKETACHSLSFLVTEQGQRKIKLAKDEAQPYISSISCTTPPY